MNSFAFALIAILSAAVLILAAERIILLRSLGDIAAQLGDILGSDTNALLTLTSRNTTVRRTVSALNGKLTLLRKKEHEINSRSDEISRAVTNIAHDMRTPLTAIGGYLEIMEKEELSPDARRCTGIIRERSDALKKLTEELFDFSLVTSDGGGLDPCALSLKAELETAIAACYTTLTQRNIEPSISLPDTPVNRILDRDCLQRIFGNILTNAAKYSDGDLEITLEENGRIVFGNTASGLSETEAGKLFDRFYTVSDARTSTGLGLSIAKILTEKSGGEIRSEYKNGKLYIILFFGGKNEC